MREVGDYKMPKTKKPSVVKAKHAGNCYLCGGVFYCGDKIRIVVDNTYTPPLTKACHKDCY